MWNSEFRQYGRKEVHTANTTDPDVKEIFSLDSRIDEVWVYQEDHGRALWTVVAMYPGVIESRSGSICSNREKALKSLKDEVSSKKEVSDKKEQL